MRFLSTGRRVRKRVLRRNRIAICECLESRLLLASLNAQYNVELQTHPVALGFDHLSVLLTPANPSLYHDDDGDGHADEDPLFVSRADGSFALSLGAGPEPAIGGNLVARFNRPNDIALHPAGQRHTLSTPAGYADSRAWANALISRSAGYGDNLDYSFFPEGIDAGFNSNSFIAGLLAATGTPVADPSTIFADGDYPGFPTPVPAADFGTAPAQRIDLTFVIDTTGSMFDDIDAVKASATEIINTVHNSFLVDGDVDARIAVVDYRDFPVSPYGDAGDYPFNDVQEFTSSPTAAIAGIQSLALGSGGDFEESVYSGLMHAIDAASLGSWRGEGVSKMMILMGDAPPHDPEPFTGFTMNDVIVAAENEDPVVIFPVAIGGSATSSFQGLADGTGGQLLTAATASDVVEAILQAIDVITNTPVADAGGPYFGSVGLPISFDASNSFDPDGDIVQYEWDWEFDGIVDHTTTEPFAQHTWTELFTGRTSVRVTDNDGLTNLDWANVSVTAAFSFVDADNDGLYTVGIDVALVGGELDDGKFDTRKTEGGYNSPIPGAGLHVGGPAISVSGDIKYRADGDLKVNTNLTSGDDIDLQSRHGSVILDDPTITASDEIEIEAALDILSTDDVIEATGPRSEVELKAGRDILLFGTTVQAVREVELQAGGNIVVADSIAPSPGVLRASDSARGKIELKAALDIDVSGSDIDAGKEVELKAGGDIFAIDARMTALSSSQGEVELKAAGDIDASGAALLASKEVELKATLGAISAVNAVIEALGSSKGEAGLKAAGDIIVDGADLRSGKGVELKSTGGSILATDARIEALGSSKGEIELRAAGNIMANGADLRASKEIEMRATGGTIFAVDALMEALGSSKAEIEMRAAGDIIVNGATLSAIDEIELKSTGGSIDATDSTVTADEVELKAAVDIILTGWAVLARKTKLKAGGVIIP